MADQRPGFRFRLPWSTAAPPPRPTFPPRPPAQPTAATTPPQTTPQTAATQGPPQPSIATTPPPTTSQTAENQVPAQPSTSTNSGPTTQTAETTTLTQPTTTTRPTPTATPGTAETQNSTQLTAAATTPTPTSERPPFGPPGVAPAQGPPLRSQTSQTESQPSSPSRATTQPRVPSQPESPSRAAVQSRAPSQPSTPPRTAPQPRAASVSSSPSRRSPQLPSAPQTTTQPRSPPLSASHPEGQTSSAPPPSSTTAQWQPTAKAVTQPTSPPETKQSLIEKRSQSSANSIEVVSPLSDELEQKSTVSEVPFVELQPKTTTTEGAIDDSQDQAPIKTSIQPNEMTEQPSKGSRMRAEKMFTTTTGPETPAVTQISNTSTLDGKPESFSKELKPEETEEVKAVVQDTEDKADDSARHRNTDLTELQAKDLPSIPFQSEQTQKTIARKETIATSASNGRKSKITTTEPRNKSMVANTSHKLGNSNGKHIPMHKNIRDDISKLVNKVAVGDSKQSIDDRPVSVITLAGENRGASMHIGSDSSRREGVVHIRRGYKIKPDDSAEATTDGEESLKAKSNNPKIKEDQASEAHVNSNVQQVSDAHVNSNVQGINNSVLFNSSVTERNPGVHIIHSHIPTESKKPSGKPGILETQKAEFNMTPSQKLTHESTVRRRCLRGLFLESSDSDSDSTKPRRHGCRVGCNQKSKENNTDAL